MRSYDDLVRNPPANWHPVLVDLIHTGRMVHAVKVWAEVIRYQQPDGRLNIRVAHAYIEAIRSNTKELPTGHEHPDIKPEKLPEPQPDPDVLLARDLRRDIGRILKNVEHNERGRNRIAIWTREEERIADRQPQADDIPEIKRRRRKALIVAPLLRRELEKRREHG